MGSQHATVFLDLTLLTFYTLSKSCLPHSFANINVLGSYLWFGACALASQRLTTSSQGYWRLSVVDVQLLATDSAFCSPVTMQACLRSL